MKTDLNRIHRGNSTYRIAVGALALAMCLGLPSFVAAQDQAAQGQAQDQQSQAGDAAAPAQSPDATAPSAAPDSTTAPADQASPPADAAPQAEAPAPQTAPQSPAPQAQPSAPSGGWHYNPAPQDQAQQAAPPAAANAPAAQAPVPQTNVPPANPPQATAPQGALPQVLTVTGGTVISVRLDQWLSSDQNHAGDIFNAELDSPIVVGGWVVARRGQSVLGRVVLAQKANNGNRESKLGLELSEITLVDGERLTVSTELVQDTTHRSSGRDVGTVGATTALGAIIGAAIGGGEGAAIGAGVGVTGGMATVMSTSGRPTILRPEQLLTFRLQSPVDINTDRGHVAFRPVTQADYGRSAPYANNPPQLRYPAGAPYPPPYPPAYPPYGPYAPYAPIGYPASPYYYGYGGYCGGPTLWSCYPGPLYFSLGLWGGWGFAPRGGVVVGPGFRR